MKPVQLTALDIGTTKVVAVLASLRDGRLEVDGVGLTASSGMRNGTVVDIAETTQAVRDAVEQAEHAAARRSGPVIIGVTGRHIRSENRTATISFSGLHRVTVDDVDAVCDRAKGEPDPGNLIVHSLPRTFTLDGQDGVKNPTGMHASEMSVELHVVQGAAAVFENVRQAVHQAGLTEMCLVVEPVATGLAVLTEAERDAGICLADIGGGTTDVAIYRNGEVCHTAAIPIAGSHVTSDISVGLRTANDESERIKLQHATLQREMIRESSVLTARSLSGGEAQHAKAMFLYEIVEARMTDLLELIVREIESAGLSQRLPGGLVLSGGGSQLRGLPDMARRITGMPTRIGAPISPWARNGRLDTPVHATAAGLLIYGMEYTKELEMLAPNWWSRIWKQIRRIIPIRPR